MPSRSILNVLNTKQVPTAEDINVLYRLINGMFNSHKGHGMPVKFTAFDARMPTGLTDFNAYALEVRNRELTQQKTAAFRRGDGTIVAAVEGGTLKSVDPSSAVPVTTRAQVMVHGTSAGGVLGGTYPNPTFALATEYHRVYPTMVVAWWGTHSITSVSDGFSGTNPEVTNAPGWVFCETATGAVKLRSGATVTPPVMNDRFPLGAGGTYAAAATFGNSMATMASFSVAHNHPHFHVHEHTVPNHAHSHVHSLNNHVHGLASHTHGMNSHVHTGAVHTHTINDHSHSINDHSHGINDHSHGPGSLSLGHRHAHSHGISDHNHTVTINSNSSTQDTNNLRTVSPEEADAAGKDHGHTVMVTSNQSSGGSATQTDNNDITSTTSSSGSTADKTGMVTQDKTGMATNDKTGMSTNNPSAANTGAATGSTAAPDGINPNTDPNNGDTGSGLTTATTGTLSTTNSTETTNDTTSSSAPSVNITPPGLAWYWIMKL